MCPSYRATREEMHSTRGRTHLLFEMMRGAELDGWRDPAHSRGAGPVPGVQGLQARLPHQRRRRDLQGRVPGPLLRGAAASGARLRDGTHPHVGAAGVDRAGRRQRAVAGAAVGGFVEAHRRAGAGTTDSPVRGQDLQGHLARARRPATPTGRRVVLWPDTFNDNFFPGTLLSAAEVLEAVGYRSWSRGRTSAAGGRCTTSGCSTARSGCCGTICACSAPRSRPERPSSGWSRPACRCSATRWST